MKVLTVRNHPFHHLSEITNLNAYRGQALETAEHKSTGESGNHSDWTWRGSSHLKALKIQILLFFPSNTVPTILVVCVQAEFNSEGHLF